MVLVRRNFDFCVFLGHIGPEIGSVGPKSNLEVKFISREISICQNPFNSTFLHLNAKKKLNSQAKRGLGEEKLRFLCFFFLGHNAVQRCSGATIQKKNTKHDIKKNRLRMGGKHFLGKIF